MPPGRTIELSVRGNFNLEAVRGTVTGISTVSKSGRNPDVDTGTSPEEIWAINGTWTPPTAARIMDIISANANDTAAGSGARTVEIFGLDGSFNAISEVVALNGATVSTVATFTRVCDIVVRTAGATGTNEGIITVTAQVDATNQALIAAGVGEALMTIYTVPNGFTAYMTNLHACFNRADNYSQAMIDVSLYGRSGIDTAEPVLRQRHYENLSIQGTSSFTRVFDPPRKFEEKTDIFVRTLGLSDSNADVSAGFDLILVENT